MTGIASVLLVDARGCHAVFDRKHLAFGADGSAFVTGQVWARVRFLPAREVTGDGLPVFRSAEPAIGPPGSLYVSKLHCPAGWREPWQLTEILAVSA
jgi:hypothetical protein